MRLKETIYLGTVSSGLETYEVVWYEQDLAAIEQHGDVLAEFCSKNSSGFVSAEDVLDQALDVVLEWDDFDLEDWDDYLDGD